MSYESSVDASDKDSVRQKNLSENLLATALRKTDLLDAMDGSRPSRDTDSWSVAATIDDQESVISVQGGLVGLSSSSTTTLSLMQEPQEDVHRLHRDEALGGSLAPLQETDDAPLGVDDDDDKGSRSNAAEFGDNGSRSTATDFDDLDRDKDQYGRARRRPLSNADGHDHAHSDKDDDDDDDEHDAPHHVVNDSISAPPQPQPSFTPMAKSYVELMEENDLLLSQIRDLRMTQKQQAQMIDHLRHLTDPTVFDQAMHLSASPSSLPPPPLLDEASTAAAPSSIPATPTTTVDVAMAAARPHSSPASSGSRELGGHPLHHGLPLHLIGSFDSTGELLPGEPVEDPTASSPTATLHPHDTPILPTHSLTSIADLLARLSEQLHQFATGTVDEPFQLDLEQHLYSTVIDAYLLPLPFGTSNQQLLNTAYRDQLRRFQSTLGSNFAKWYRRQTVQSLALNPATKEYLEHTREQILLQLMDTLASMKKNELRPQVNHQQWVELMQCCQRLSLEIHGAEADVFIEPITIGTDFDQDSMLLAAASKPQGKVKQVIRPLFINENEQILLSAKVLLA
ncbi:hypothetical protein DM01DRAFT_1335057 [Hesseltinella vesiculosa]|uniref:Uncharacterized protein n=1 Tax=Hesseltinella vesiculosa TaxID=101127 RepID=A0A1X2GK66_9FUNG|nr:hypothetical protein DM01DRAFT_1335057 [Hesseltinella vesiculosa]